MQLHDFLTDHRDEILVRCTAKVASRRSPVATEAELHGVPLFLDQLVDALRSQLDDSPAISASAAKHGRELLQRGFNAAQVVHDYGDVCQAVTELAEEMKAPIATNDFRVLNRCLDDAIAESVTEFVEQRGRASEERSVERLGFLAHEVRNLLNTATLAFEAIRTGAVGVSGSTSNVLGRSLTGLKELINNTLTEVRLDARTGRAGEVTLAAFIDDVATSACIEAKAFPIHFAVEPVPAGIVVLADGQILAAAVTNLLGNAFKFTRAEGRVSLRTRATADRVFIDVQDECGGLASEDPEELFRTFGQFNADRTGMGLGLSIARRGVMAMNGAIHVRNIPGVGCVFTADLPRVAPRPHRID